MRMYAIFFSTLVLYGNAFAKEKLSNRLIHPELPVGEITIDDPKAVPWDLSFSKESGRITITGLGDISLAEKNGQIWEAQPEEGSTSRISIESSEGQGYLSLGSHVYDEASGRLFVCSNKMETDKKSSSEVAPSVVSFQLSPDGSFVWAGSTKFTDKPGQICGGLAIVKGVLFAINKYATDTTYPAVYATDIGNTSKLPETMPVVQTYGDIGYTSEQTIKKYDLITSVRGKNHQSEDSWSVYLLDSARLNIMEVSFKKDEKSGVIERSGEITELLLPKDMSLPITFYNYDDSNFFVAAEIINIYLIRYSPEGEATIIWTASSPSLITGITVGSEKSSEGEEPVRTVYTTSPVLVKDKYVISKFSFPTIDL